MANEMAPNLLFKAKSVATCSCCNGAEWSVRDEMPPAKAAKVLPG